MIDGFAHQFAVAVDGEHPHLTVPLAATAKAKAALTQLKLKAGPLIVIHSGPTWPVKQWPKLAWTELAGELKRLGFQNLVQVGVSQLPLKNEKHDIGIPGVQPLMDEFTLEESIALIAEADLFVGVDSGLLHIAAALRIPAVGIFGPTTPTKYYSPCSTCTFVTSTVACQGCHHRLPCLHWITNCPFDINCMKSIAMEKVLQASLARLKPR